MAMGEVLRRFLKEDRDFQLLASCLQTLSKNFQADIGQETMT
jgi:hypothetical protein